MPMHTTFGQSFKVFLFHSPAYLFVSCSSPHPGIGSFVGNGLSKEIQCGSVWASRKGMFENRRSVTQPSLWVATPDSPDSPMLVRADQEASW